MRFRIRGFFSIIKDNLNFLKGSKSGAGTQEETASWNRCHPKALGTRKLSSSENITEFNPSIAKHDHVQRLKVQLITCFFRMCSQWISHHLPFAQHFSTRYIITSQFLVPCFPPTTAASATT
jgi:hypothetical protein